MASIKLFEQRMVWDVVPVIFFYRTTQKKKVLLPLPRNNREDVQSTASETCKSCAPVADRDAKSTTFSLILTSVFLFFCLGFQRKATRAGDEKLGKKSAWPYCNFTKVRCGIIFVVFDGQLFIKNKTKPDEKNGRRVQWKVEGASANTRLDATVRSVIACYRNGEKLWDIVVFPGSCFFFCPFSFFYSFLSLIFDISF